MQKKKRIVFFLNSIGSGGSEQYLYLLAKEAVKNAYAVSFVSSGGDKEEELRNLGVQIINVPIMKIGKNSISELNLKQRKFLNYFQFFLKYIYLLYLKAFVKKNVSYVISQHGFPTILADLYAKNMRLEHINIVHHILPNEYTDIYSELNINPDKFVAVSKEIKDFLQSKLSTSKIYLLPNPIDFSLIDTVVSDTHSDNNDFTITLVSHVHEDKQESLDAFVALAQKLDNKMVFKLCGNYKNNWGIEFYNKNKDHVQFLGNLDAQNLYRTIANSKLIIGVGRCAMESIALGKPVIVCGHVKGKYGGNYSGLIRKDSISRVSYNNYSGRSEKETVSVEKLMSDVMSIASINVDRNAELEELKSYLRENNSSEVVFNHFLDILNE